MNICRYLRRSAQRFPTQPAVIFGDETIAYGELYGRALKFAGLLTELGLRRGDRVAVAMRNNARMFEVIFGALAGQFVIVPINFRLHPREIADIVVDSAAGVLVYDEEYHDATGWNAELFGDARLVTVGEDGRGGEFEQLMQQARPLAAPVDVSPDADAWLFFTSGTTGRAKGARWSHRTIDAMLISYLADVHNIQPGDHVLHAAPLSHGSGIVALPSIARAATNVVLVGRAFDAEELFRTVERHAVSHIAFLAPTQIQALTKSSARLDHDLRSLEAVCYGGAPIHVGHLRAAIDAFGPVFVQIYGQGEAPITVTSLSRADHERFAESGDQRLGSAGTPRLGVEVKIVDDDGGDAKPGAAGEVVVRGDVVMKGYWNSPAETDKAIRDSWLHTGDLGYFDDTGYLHLLDRSKDVIISGGSNIYPREIEDVLVRLPGVSEAVVFGVPDDYWGEAVHAVIVVAEGSTVTEADVITHCQANLASYKKPRSVELVRNLPVSGYGKILKRELRQRHWAGHSQQLVGGDTAPSGRDALRDPGGSS